MIESTEEAPISSGRRPFRIAFLVDWLNDSYQLALLRGAAEEAMKQGATLVAFPGGVLGADHGHGACRNRIYECLSPEAYDGVVVLTGTLGNVYGGDVMTAICPAFPKERVCHVAVEVSGSSAVLIDNARGIQRMVEHLVWAHGRKNIAFIRGPESNPEAEARFEAYRQALEANNVAYNARLVAPGDFRREAGTEAISLLLDERCLGLGELDAVVAADDLMAMAAMEALIERGISVPGEIAVAGFDDVEEARYASPPLTTVRQPLGAQGRAAVQAVLASLKTGAPTPVRILDTTGCLRRSCGCTADDPGFLTERPKSDTRLSLSQSVDRRRPLIAEEVLKSTEGLLVGLSDGWADHLVDALLRVFGGEEAAFRDVYDRLLDQVERAGGDVVTGHVLISALRRQLSICAGDDPLQIRRVEGLLHDARILTSNAVERNQASRRIYLEKSLGTLAEVSVRLSRGVPLADVRALLQAELPRLGVRTCLIAAYDASHPGISEVICAMGFGVDALPSLMGTRFATAELGPAGYLPEFESEQLVVQPLFDGTRPLGFSVVRLAEVDERLHETLRGLLNVVLLRALSMAQPT